MSRSHRCPFLVTLCGLPGSGKSTLSRRLLAAAENDGFSVHIVEFDMKFHSKQDNCEQFNPAEWKVRIVAP